MKRIGGRGQAGGCGILAGLSAASLACSRRPTRDEFHRCQVSMDDHESHLPAHGPIIVNRSARRAHPYNPHKQKHLRKGGPTVPTLPELPMLGRRPPRPTRPRDTNRGEIRHGCRSCSLPGHSRDTGSS